MEGSLPLINGNVSKGLMELEANDKETYDLWNERRDKSLMKDHPESLKILQEVLEEVIAKKGWTILPYQESPNGEIIATIKKQWPMSHGSHKNKTIALLRAYL